MSKQFEHDMVNRCHDESPEYVRTYRCGYSGSNRIPQPDMLITDVQFNHAFELKGPLARDHIYIDEGDLQQLEEVRNGNTNVYLGIKFQNRELLALQFFETIRIRKDGKAISHERLCDQWAELIPDAFDATTTESGSLRINKPSTEEWNSQQSGRPPEIVLLSAAGVKNSESI